MLYNMLSSSAWLETLDPDVLDQVDVVFGDVRDPASVRELVEGASVVYHLAASDRSRTPTARRGPSWTPTRSAPCTCSRPCAPAGRPGWCTPRPARPTAPRARCPISESHPLQAQSPYAASKVAADKLAESYHLSFGLPVVTLRPFNTFGPRQSTRAVIPQIITQLAERLAPAQAGRAGPDPGLLLRHRHRPGVHDPRRGSRPRRSSASCSTAAPATTSRSASSRRTSPGLWASRRTSSRTPAAAPQGLGGDAAGVRRDEAARAHRVAAAASPGTRACARPSSGSASRRTWPGTRQRVPPVSQATTCVAG